LAEVAKIGEQTLAVGSIEDMVAIYKTSGWQADWAALKSIQSVTKGTQLEAVQIALASIYLPWIEEAARQLQQLVTQNGYPKPKLENCAPPEAAFGTLMLFVDGLRFDLAEQLIERLNTAMLTTDCEHVWAALPSVTATAKPAASPVCSDIVGADISADFEPEVKATGKSLKGGYHFKKLLTEQGWHILSANETGEPTGRAWTEIGDIDTEGHADASKLAKNTDSLLQAIVDRISNLFESGWKQVEVVTDHGFLLLPGGLPSIKLSSSLSENTWGRCAALKPGAQNEEGHFSWFWNTAHSFALPDGVSCYGRKREYAHGGLSLQECLTQKITITPNVGHSSASVKITDQAWRGMRLTVAVEESASELRLDIRKHAGDPNSSVAMSPKPFKQGKSSVVIEDDELLGSIAHGVILNDEGQIVAQFETTIGGNE
jgi:hypothetical protein